MLVTKDQNPGADFHLLNYLLKNLQWLPSAYSTDLDELLYIWKMKKKVIVFISKLQKTKPVKLCGINRRWGTLHSRMHRRFQGGEDV